MIQAAAMDIRFGTQVAQITATLRPHLTNSKALKLACQTFNKDISKAITASEYAAKPAPCIGIETRGCARGY